MVSAGRAAVDGPVHGCRSRTDRRIHGSIAKADDDARRRIALMNFTDIKILYVRELRSALRDRSIVTNSILLPIFLYPLIMWLLYTGLTFISGQNEEMKS